MAPTRTQNPPEGRSQFRSLRRGQYDELIELAFRDEGAALRRSVLPSEFMQHMAYHEGTHLVKLHGTIDEPASIVLTRNDYARSRKDRVEMFSYLGQQLRYASFLFIGFSLTDPNFTLIHDEALLATGGTPPVSYVVQGSHDVIKEAYLRARGINTISLDSWNELPQLFRQVNP